MRKNINDRDIEEVELILAPKCEFRASDKLKTRILDEARVLSRGKKFRFVPWVAAACFIGLLFMLICYMQPGNMNPDKPLISESIKIEETAALPNNLTTAGTTVIEIEEKEAVSVVQQKDTGVIIKKQAPQNSKIFSETASVKIVETPAVIESKDMTEIVEISEIHIEGEMPMASGNMAEEQAPMILAETDIPIAYPENMVYTSEEIAKLKSQADKDYLSRVRLKMEIAEQLISSYP